MQTQSTSKQLREALEATLLLVERGETYQQRTEDQNYMDAVGMHINFSDYLWELTHSDEMLKAFCDIIEDDEFDASDVFMEFFCDHAGCERFIQNLGDLISEAQGWMRDDPGCAGLTVQEIDYRKVHAEADDANYVIILTGDWKLSIERYVDRLPRPTGSHVVIEINGDRQYFMRNKLHAAWLNSRANLDL